MGEKRTQESGIAEMVKGKRPAAPKVKGVFERGGEWWIRWHCTLGHEHREKVGPRGLAKERHGARRREVREARRDGREYCPNLDPRPHPIMFKDLCREYKAYAEANKRSHRDDRPRLARLLKAFRRKLARDITPQDVEALKVSLATTARGGRRGGDPEERGNPLKVATVNHHLKLLKAIFNRGIKTGKLTYNPVRAVKLFKENNARNRCLSAEEEARLFAHLPESIKPLVTVALHTGMRQGELLALRWDDVDFYTGTLRVREAKSGEGRSVVMNSVVRAALQTVRREQIQKARAEAKGGREILSPYVFCSNKGRFLHNLAKAWYPALEAAGIEDFRFHDLRTHLRISPCNGGRGPVHRATGRGVENGGHGPAVRAPVAGPCTRGGGAADSAWKRHPDRHQGFSWESRRRRKC